MNNQKINKITLLTLLILGGAFLMTGVTDLGADDRTENGMTKEMTVMAEELPVIVATKNDKTPSLQTGMKMYRHYCTPCHGLKGDGKGFNSEYLDPKPANHTDKKEMAKRTDEKLYDTIAEGGKSVGKSTYMPPWGGTFSEAQIESLVLYLRKLCNCKGPG